MKLWCIISIISMHKKKQDRRREMGRGKEDGRKTAAI